MPATRIVSQLQFLRKLLQRHMLVFHCTININGHNFFFFWLWFVSDALKVEPQRHTFFSGSNSYQICVQSHHQKVTKVQGVTFQLKAKLIANNQCHCYHQWSVINVKQYQKWLILIIRTLQAAKLHNSQWDPTRWWPKPPQAPEHSATPEYWFKYKYKNVDTNTNAGTNTPNTDNS